ncbi:uncharacterized protein LAJ45_07991 [Morchella importuna]|uniref:uncharacterized protein n=1 Tax=Morchella importuna TaxID=1174673 RepID=UPI001E8CDF93|nr:uncharacterized protein LAJ45_07991 [Morchella importuna]KAH8147890.1 hypothetical protein LAJ45_07991 [Morchella importuna]
MESSLPSPDATPLLPPPGGADLSSLMASFFNPSLPVLIVTVIVIFLTPLLIHTLIFRSRAATTLPTFLLVGPVGGGKTSLMTAFESETESGKPPPDTRTSQSPLSLECSISAAIAGTSKYRSANDPSMKSYLKFLLSDTPGHGKLRHLALSQISSPVIRGVIFVLDSSLTDVRGTAEYLYDVLLAMQKVASASGATSSQPKRLLIACNKSDVFTALPAGKIQKLLEEEITKMRVSRSKGILDVEDDGEGNEEKEWLGEGGEGPFEFKAMEEVGVEVEVKGGSVEKKDWKEKLSAFIGGCL